MSHIVANPEEGIIREAVQRSRPADSLAVATGSGRTPASSTPPAAITTAGTDGDGNTYTIHPFMLDVDHCDDPGAILI